MDLNLISTAFEVDNLFRCAFAILTLSPTRWAKFFPLSSIMLQTNGGIMFLIFLLLVPAEIQVIHLAEVIDGGC